MAEPLEIRYSRLLSGRCTQEEIANIAIDAVKTGNIQLANIAFSRLEEEDTLIKLYKGRLLSLEGKFNDFIEFSATNAKSILEQSEIKDALSPWYWREGISYAILGQDKKSEYAFDKMKDKTTYSQHELAHYYQCYGAVTLFKGYNLDKAQELLANSISIYTGRKQNSEPYYTQFDDFRCVFVNLILQAIIDLKNEKYYIAYRKLLYCRRWAQKYSFSRTATGISEISTLFRTATCKWVFDFVFCNENEYFAILNRYIKKDIMAQVLREEIGYQSLNSKTIESSIKSFNKDYLLMNEFPEERYSKVYYIHLEEVDMRTKKVFIIHGRNTKAYNEFVAFLTSLRLDPIEWDEAISLTHNPSPYIGEIIDNGFQQAQAIIVLLTPDENVELVEELQSEEGDDKVRKQSRANVIFEAGAAWEKYPNQTIFVQMGDQALWSDIDGIDIVRISNNIDARRILANRLRVAGCTVDIISSRIWQTQGNLDVCN